MTNDRKFGYEINKTVRKRRRDIRSTTSTDRLLNSSTGSGLSQSKTAIGAHVLHSIPPKTSSKSNHRPYHQTTTSTVSKHAKYDKVPTQDNLHRTYDINSKKLVSKVPKFYKVLPQTSVKKNDDMGIDSKSQMKQNMSQIFSMEEPIKPNKDLYVRTRHDESIPIKDRNSIWPQNENDGDGRSPPLLTPSSLQIFL
ncbi:hypothetical protein Phum_PHUM616030 [Pediculus humanus corporis]|uniref:Uncharacterized protein n=1 Tax=Pediculus humanus subsp. corporis TaxID=121224 RepID=E0W470_PEDHC|nr:uncharacterized protein Phum_PHUM616030 [Pediculus humanus corporis]EEB20426.1 hypothetical protein Phum_PHUM616030 [Pediculus humanus corporis]